MSCRPYGRAHAPTLALLRFAMCLSACLRQLGSEIHGGRLTGQAEADAIREALDHSIAKMSDRFDRYNAELSYIAGRKSEKMP